MVWSRNENRSRKNGIQNRENNRRDLRKAWIEEVRIKTRKFRKRWAKRRIEKRSNLLDCSGLETVQKDRIEDFR